MRTIEASVVMPLTILIIAALIALMMNYYSDLDAQIDKHKEEIKKLYEVSETVGIRLHDRIAYEKKNHTDE